MTDSRYLPAPENRTAPPPGELFTQDGRGTDAEFELRDFLGILIRRKWIVLICVAVSLAITSALIYFEDPIYRATAMFRIEDTQTAMGASLDQEVTQTLTGRTAAEEFVLSQLEILHSAQVLGEVVDREGLRLVSLDGGLPMSILADVEVSPEIVTDTVLLAFEGEGVRASSGRTPEVRAPYGSPVELDGVRFTVLRPYQGKDELRLVVRPRERAIKRLTQNLLTRPRGGTDVVTVEYPSTDPELAMQVVNAAVEAFRERNIQAARQLSQRRIAFLEEQMTVYDSLLIEAQETLSQFRSRERVYSSAEWFAAQQTGLLEMEIRLQELNADRQMFRSILGDLQLEPGEVGDRLQSLAASPDIAENPVVAELFRQLIDYEATRDSLLGGPWGAARTNPDVTRLEEQIRNTTGRLESAVHSHLESLDARVVALEGLQAQKSGEMTQLPEVEAEEARLVQQVESIQQTVELLREQHQLASIAEAVQAGQIDVIDLASVPLDAENTSRGLKLMLGLVLGLILGGVAAFLRESLNTRIRQREEMEQALRVTSVGVIPRIPANGRRIAVPAVAKVRRLVGRTDGNSSGSNGHGAAELVTIAQRGSPHAEAFRSIRTNLLFSDAVQSLRTLVVTSPTPEEGKTTTAANLAVAYAQQGLSVLLLDCDLRRARLHRLLGFPREPGVTDVLLGHTSWEEVSHELPVERMDFLASGILPPNPSELLGGERMREALKEIRERYELVLLDTPPVIAGPDAAILGSMCDGVVLVVRAGHTEREAGQQAVRQLNGVGARIVGAVLNDPDGALPKYSSYYSYQYKYYAENT